MDQADIPSLEVSFEPGQKSARDGAYRVSLQPYPAHEFTHSSLGHKNYCPGRSKMQSNGHGEHGAHCGTFDFHVASPDGATLVVSRNGEAPEVFPLPSNDSYLFVNARGGDGGAPVSTRMHPGRGGRGGDVRVITTQLELLSVLDIDVRGGSGSSIGPSGEIEYLVRTPEGTFRANKLYCLSVISFSSSSLLGDGIIQPGDTLTLYNITLKNSGDLPLPAGTVLRFSNDPHNVLRVNSPQEPFTVPYLLPGQEYMLPFPVVCTVADLHPRQRAGMERATGYATKCELPLIGAVMGRLEISKSFQAHIEWPIKLNTIKVPADCTLGSTLRFDVGLENVSSLPFSMERQDGVRVRFWIDRRVAPSVGAAEQMPPEATKIPFDVRVPSIPALQMMNLSVSLPLSTKASIESYDKFEIEIELFYNNVLVQWSNAEIRVTPTYTPSAPQDVILFTGRWLDKESFHLWELLFRKLDLVPQYWDLDHIGSFTHRTEEDGTQTTWIRTTGAPDRRIILMPVPIINGDIAQSKQRMPWQQLVEHNRSFPIFQTPGGLSTPPTPAPPEIQALLQEMVMKNTAHRIPDLTQPLLPLSVKFEDDYVATEDDWGIIVGNYDVEETRQNIIRSTPLLNMSDWWVERFLIKTPATRHAQRSAAAILEQLKQVFPSAWVRYIPELSQERITRIGESNWYSFGNITYGVSQIRRVSKLHCIDMNSMRDISRLHSEGELLREQPPVISNGQYPRVGYAGLKMNQNWMAVASTWRDWFFYVISALPVERQLLILNNQDIANQHFSVAAREAPGFFGWTKSGARSMLDVTIVDFLMILLFWELRWDTIIQDSAVPRWNALLTACKKHGAEFVKNKNIILVITYAMRRCELNKCGNVAKQIKDIKAMIEMTLYGENAKKNADFIKIKKERDAYFEKHAKRIYFCDFFRHNGMFALANRTPPEKYWMRLEREHVWADEV